MSTPRLFEHDRHNTRAELLRNKAIAIVKCFGIDQGVASEYDQKMARETLDWLRTRQCWIACGCLGTTNTPPLIAPAMREGVLYLRRNPQPLHDATCPLRHPPVQSPSAIPSANASAPVTSWQGGWNLAQLPATQVATQASSTKQPLTSRHPRDHTFPRLGRVLLSALERAGVHQIFIRDVFAKRGELSRAADPSTFFARMKVLDAEVVAGDITWADIHCFSPTAIRALLGQRLPKLEAEHSIRGYRHQGYFLGVVDGVESQKVADYFIKNADPAPHRIKVEGRIATFGLSIGTPGPYWLLAHAQKPNGGQSYTFVKAYAHPVFSKSLPIPVDSDLERKTLDEIFHTLKRLELQDKRHGGLLVRKPLLDLQTPAGETCRPDFEVIRPDGARLLIECMGRDDPDYEASKAITHPRMRSLPNVVDLVAYAPGTDHPTVLMKALQEFAIGTP